MAGHPDAVAALRPAVQGANHEPGESVLLGSLNVIYGTPGKYDITIYRVSVTMSGSLAGWNVESLCDEALGYGGYTLADCRGPT